MVDPLGLFDPDKIDWNQINDELTDDLKDQVDDLFDNKHLSDIAITAFQLNDLARKIKCNGRGRDTSIELPPVHKTMTLSGDKFSVWYVVQGADPYLLFTATAKVSLKITIGAVADFKCCCNDPAGSLPVLERLTLTSFKAEGKATFEISVTRNSFSPHINLPPIKVEKSINGNKVIYTHKGKICDDKGNRL
jgi:hypothetical protein